MFKLIHLEYKKAQLQGLIISAIIACFVLIIWCVWNQSGLHGGYVDYHTAFSEIGFYTNSTSSIISATLISKIVLAEYHTRTITVLYTYPHSRTRLLIAKLAFISLFTFVTACLLNLIVASIFITFIPSIQPELGSATHDLLVSNLIRALLFAIATIGTSLISFFFGMLKKSTPATISSPFLIALTMGSRYYYLESVTTILVFTLGWFILGIILSYLSLKKTDQLDAI